MESSVTLHDFVLNLICDATARAEFETDPEGALQAAGLGDICAADVQEVIPLVVDYAPINGVSTLPAVDQITAMAPEADVAGAVSQLQAITHHLTAVAVPGGDGHGHGVNLSVAGAVTINTGGLSADGLLPGLDLPGLGGGHGGGYPGDSSSGGGLSPAGDPIITVDADAVAPAGTLSHDTVIGTGEVVSETALSTGLGTVDLVVNTATNLAPAGELLDSLHLGGVPSVSSLPVDTSSVVPELAEPLPAVTGATSGVTDAASGLTGTVQGLGDTGGLGDATAGVGGLLGGASAPAEVTDLLS